MMRRSVTVAALAVAGLAPSLPAQDVQALCDEIRRSALGQWAEYRSTGSPSPVQSVRISVVGEDARAGKKLQWIEMQMGSGADRMIAQVLVPGIGFGPNDIEGMVMKVGDQPAMKMPESMISTMRSMAANEGVMDFAKECATADVLGREDITVPAGTFETTHIKSSQGEAWMSEKVNFGLVKGKGQDGTELVLAGHGNDARSAITETPREMPMGGMGDN